MHTINRGLRVRSQLCSLFRIILGSSVLNIAIPVRAGDAQEETVVRNLAAFARVYGYVRFFHPSDEASAVDWHKFLVAGAGQVRDADNIGALANSLMDQFGPIAPNMRIALGRQPDSTRNSSDKDRLTFWQYGGIKLTDTRGPYQQRRVILGEPNGDRSPLFHPVDVPMPIAKEIAPGMTMHLETALPVGTHGATVGGSAQDLLALQDKIESLNGSSSSIDDWRVRVAGVIETWNVFQHFHPYLSEIGVNWLAVLEPALRRALRSQDKDEYYRALMEMIARSDDGHGFVFGRSPDTGRLPVRVDVIERRLVVTRVLGSSPLRKGDIIERYEGASALEILREIEQFTPGSPQLRRFRALNQFGEGTAGATVMLDVIRGGQPMAIEVQLIRGRRMYFFTQGEFDFPALEEVRPGIFYVNLHACDTSTFAAALSRLAKARGVIFDNRLGSGRSASDTTRLQSTRDVIPHLIAETVHASPMLVPQITEPDRQGWSYFETTWPVQPREPRFQGKAVYINDASVVSYGETVMAIVAGYRLATLVGGSTAGCNGNGNFVPLPGGFRVMWTGMDVRRHDRTSFYNVGFQPDVPVSRTINAVINGRDEYLENAIRVIEEAR